MLTNNELNELEKEESKNQETKDQETKDQEITPRKHYSFFDETNRNWLPNVIKETGMRISDIMDMDIPMQILHGFEYILTIVNDFQFCLCSQTDEENNYQAQTMLFITNVDKNSTRLGSMLVTNTVFFDKNTINIVRGNITGTEKEFKKFEHVLDKLYKTYNELITKREQEEIENLFNRNNFKSISPE